MCARHLPAGCGKPLQPVDTDNFTITKKESPRIAPCIVLRGVKYQKACTFAILATTLFVLILAIYFSALLRIICKINCEKADMVLVVFVVMPIQT